MQSRTINIFLLSFFVALLSGIFFLFPKQALANAPDLEGKILTAQTKAPVAGVWIKWIDGKGNFRYAQTDDNGNYIFPSWQNSTDQYRLSLYNTQIDTNLDGQTDTAASNNKTTVGFGCDENPHSFQIITPVEWNGTFSSLSNIQINNTGSTMELPDIIYTPAAPTATPIPTTLQLNSLLDGIGSRGDNSNPDGTLSNKNPLHPQRNITINIFNASNQLIATSTNNMNYNSASGEFDTTLTIAQPITTDNYTIKATTDNHLTRLLPGIQHIAAGQNNELPKANFIAGDINNDNKLDIVDYNTLIGCYSDLSAPTSCNDTQNKTASDLNDDGTVNQFDYNLFLRELAVQSGN